MRLFDPKADTRPAFSKARIVSQSSLVFNATPR